MAARASKQRLILVIAAISTVSGISAKSFADVTWVGGAAGGPQDWNNQANWSGPTSGQGVDIETATGNYPIITANSTLGNVDVLVGTGAGASGRIDQVAGTAGTGNGNWMYLGDQTGTALFNLANTASSGGTFTGFSQGTGSFNVGGTTPNGANLFIGLDNGTTSTLNVNTTGTLSSGYIYVGGAGSSKGTLNIDSGSVIAQNDIQVGGSPFNNPATTSDALNMSGGVLTGNTIAFSRGQNNGSTSGGTADITGGTINARAYLTLGFCGTTAAQGILTNSGGTINVNTGSTAGPALEMSTYDSAGALFNQNSGSLNLYTNANIGFGNGGNNNGTSIFNQNGGNVTFYSDAGVTPGGTGSLILGVGNSSGTYTYNLSGGILTVPSISRVSTGGTGTFNFNGGTLKATSSTTSFMTGLTAANVLTGGAIINSNAQNITIGQALLTGVAGDGGLIKNGAGALTLGGSSTYTGPTSVNAGTLVLGSTASINGTSAITLNNGAGFIQLSSTPLTQPLTVTSGTLDGVGSLSSATLNSSTSNVLSSGNGSIGQLSISSLTFNGAATTKFITSLATNTSAGILTNFLATGSVSGAIKVNVIDTDSSVANGVYDLLAYNTSTGAGYNAFSLGTVSGLSGRQVASLVNVIGATDYVALNVTGVAGAIVWTGATNGNWTTTASAKNWLLNGAATSFVTGDNAVFNDSATGTTTISITDATVAPSVVTFNNSSLNYTINGPGAISGGTAVTLNGTASVTLNNGNTYTGGTTLNSGTLNINNAAALSTGTLTINGGSIDNTSAGPVTLSTNTPETWNNSFTYVGTQPLNTGSGAVTLATNAVVTTTAGTLTVGGNISGSGFGLDKEGAGALTLAGSVGYSGSTIINAGTLNINNSLTTIGNLYMSNTGGNSTLNLNGTAAHASLLLGNSSGGVAAVYANSGVLNQSGGSSVNGFNLGNAAGAFGYLNVAAGATVISGDENIASINGGDGLLEVNGGTVNNSGWLTMTRSVATATQYGTVNVYSGTYNFAGNGLVANWGGQQTAVVNVQGGNLISSNNTYIDLNFSTNNTNSSELNLNGGVTQTASVTGTGAVLSFNGGTLRATSANTAFITVGSAYIYHGGATIDTNGNNITINQALLAPTGSGVTAPTVTNGGSGYVAPPIVTVTPGSGDTTGTGATAIATINKTTGALTGITITNPGVGYTAPPQFNFVDTGGASTAATLTSNAPVANVQGGGLTKIGSGVLTLKAANTYTGPTVISAGTLQLGTLPATALVAAYSFDNTTATPVGTPTNITNSASSIAALNGTVVQSNTSTSSVSVVSGGPNINGNGGAGNSLAFDGSGGKVDIASGIVDLSGASSWTFSTWINTGQSGASIFSKNTNGSWANGNSEFYFGNGTNGSGTYPSAVRYAGGFLTGSTPTTDGNWHMVSYVDNGGTKTIYVDGVVSSQTQSAFTTPDIGTQVELGYATDPGDGANLLMGNLDDLNFYSGALTSAQIQNLYNTNNAGIVSAAPPNVLPATTAVVMPTAGAILDLNGNAQTIGSLNGVSGTIVALGGGTLTLGDTTSTTFAGVISDTGGASTSTGGGIIKQGSGTLTLSGANTYGGPTQVNTGTLLLTTASALPVGTNLVIASGASTILSAHATVNEGILQVTQLQLAGATNAWTGKLDLNNNAIDIQSGVLSVVTNELKQGFKGGAWNGTGGIVSTSASTDSTHLHAIGVLVNDNGAGIPLYGAGGTIASTFESITPSDGDVLAKYTYYGDANLDGKVDGSDYSRIDAAYLADRTNPTAQTGWYNGDFNYDGVLNGSDYTLIDNAYNRQSAQITADVVSPTSQIAAISGSSAVPEPATVGLTIIGAAGLLGRRRRNGR